MAVSEDTRSSGDDARLRVIIVAPSLDGTDVGEVYSAFQTVEALSHVADVTVLGSSRIGAKPLAEQLPLAEVVTWPEIPFLYQKMERLNAQAKPGQPLFARHVRRWVRQVMASGRSFDIAHQILPQAMRHGAVPRGLGIPYVLGPLAGGLETPPAFAGEVGNGGSMAVRFRALDSIRLKYDPFLRASFRDAALILGVAPYVAEKLAPIGKINFRNSLERGHGVLPPEKTRQSNVGELNLVHVGRTIRTKGLRDVVRAMAKLDNLPGVHLTSLGDGDDLAACRAEAEQLGVADRITFMGQATRDVVEEEYAKADVFCFPSFREPMGGVFFEALAHGLPVITAARGGPDFIIDDTCGIRLPVDTPEQFSTDIAAAITTLAMDPAKRLALGTGARERLKSFGTWDTKAAGMIEMYRDAIQRAPRT